MSGTTATHNEFLSLIEASIPAAGYATVGAFFELAQRAYDQPVGGCTPPPLVPMVHRAQLPNEIWVGIVAIMQLPQDTKAMVVPFDAAAAPTDSDEELELSPQLLKTVPLCVGLIHNSGCRKSHTAVYVGLRMLRKLLDVDNEYTASVLVTGVLPRLVEILQQPLFEGEPCALQSHVTMEAMELLCKLGWGTSDMKLRVFDAAVVSAFVAHVARPLSEGVVARCASVIADVVERDISTKDAFVAHGVAVVLADCISEYPFARVETLRSAVRAAGNVSSGTALPAVRPLLRVFTALLSHGDDGVAAEAAWGLFHAASGHDNRVGRLQAVIDAGAVPRLLEQVSRQDDGFLATAVVTPVLRTIASFSNGTAAQVKSLRDCGARQRLEPLMSHSKRAIVNDANAALAVVGGGGFARRRNKGH